MGNCTCKSIICNYNRYYREISLTLYPFSQITFLQKLQYTTRYWHWLTVKIENLSIMPRVPPVILLWLYPLTFCLQFLSSGQPLILFSISIILTRQKCYIRRIVQYVTFYGWLFSISIILWKCMQVVAYISSFVHFYAFDAVDVPGYWCTTVDLSLQSLKDISVVSILWLLSCYKHLYTGF